MGKDQKENNFGTQRIAFKLNKSAEKKVKQKHPWVFDESISKQNQKGKAGDIAIVFDENSNKFLACGLYDPHSPIRLKLMQFGVPRNMDESFFKDLIEDAYIKRKPILNTNTNAYRLIYGENDHMPSLIVDIYDNTMVVKIYSLIWFPYLECLLNILIDTTDCTAAVLRLSRNVIKVNKDPLIVDGSVIFGSLKNPEVAFIEHGIKFTANLIKGHKTGFFLDHRHNRAIIGNLSKNKTVLDVFSYAGGFSVHALVGKATEVTSIDISGQALQIAKKNAALNKYKGKHKTIVGDAFDILSKQVDHNKEYDLVIIDPPSFAKSLKEKDKAKTSYFRLAQLGSQLVKKNGTLVLASCSSRIEADLFFLINEQAMNSQDVNFQVLNKTFHDIDHPIGFPEGAYLKCAYYKILN